MKTIDTAVLARYDAGIERSRLRTGEGLLAVSKNPVVPKRIHGDPNSRALTGNEIVL